MRCFVFIWIVCLQLAGIAGHALGASAEFSEDGKAVYLPGSKGLEMIEVATGKKRTIDLSSFAGKQEVECLAKDQEGRLLVLTGTHIWAYSPATKHAEIRYTIGKRKELDRDMAFDPESGGLLLVDYDAKADENTMQWFAKPKSKATNVSSRRVRFFKAPVFNPDGQLYFGSEGDLWHGLLVAEGEGESARMILNAYRYAPVATLETENATPSALGVRALCVAGEFIYAQINRLGGSGSGETVRLKKPLPLDIHKEAMLPYGVTEYREKMLRALTSLEVLGDSNGYLPLCATPDGNKVFCAGDRDDYFLIESHGARTPVPKPE